MDLKRLRQETAAEHSGTEETVPLMREDLTRAMYVECLRRFYRVVRAWDAWCDKNAPADLIPLLKGRRRATLLADDLQFLGGSGPIGDLANSMDVTIPGDARSIFLGRMYVMEGSTLGGQYIAAHVEEKLGLSHGLGDSYFVGYGAETSTRWQEFRSVLTALDETQADTVIDAAKQMFTIFRIAMNESL